MRGVVQNATNGKPGQNLAVEIQCTAGDDFYLGETNSNGAYSISVADELGRPGCTADNGYYAVEVENWPVLIGLSQLSSQWNQHWNESIVVWAPQFVNFYLNPSPLSPTPVVSVMEFSHTGYATMSFCKGSSSTAETEADYSVGGTLFQGSYSVSSSTAYTNSFGSQSCVINQGEPGFEAWGYPYVSGMIVYNAIGNRTPWIPWEQYFGPLQNSGSGNVTGAPVQDWMAEPTQETAACFNSQYDTYMYHYEVLANTNTETFSFEIGSSVTGVTSLQFGVSIPFEINGV